MKGFCMSVLWSGIILLPICLFVPVPAAIKFFAATIVCAYCTLHNMEKYGG